MKDSGNPDWLFDLSGFFAEKFNQEKSLYGFPAKEQVMEEEIRKAAMRRYILQGESPKAICTSLNRSKKWFYKWLRRYHTQGRAWHRDKIRCSPTGGERGRYDRAKTNAGAHTCFNQTRTQLVL